MWPRDGLAFNQPSQPQPNTRDYGNEVHDPELRRAIEEIGEDMRMVTMRMLGEAQLNITKTISKFANSRDDRQPSQGSANTDHQLSTNLDVAQEQISSMIFQQQVVLKKMYAVRDLYDAERKQITRPLHREFATEVQTLLLQQGVELENLVQLNGNLLALMQTSEEPSVQAIGNNDLDETEPETVQEALTSSCSGKLQQDALQLMDVTTHEDPLDAVQRNQDRVHKKRYYMAHIADHYIGEIANMCEWFMNLQEPSRQGVLADFVNGSCFNTACTVAILLNAAVVALYSQLDVQAAVATGRASHHPNRKYIEATFVAFYTLEAVLKLRIHKAYYFVGKDMGWNIFDFSLIFMGILNFASDQMHLSGGSINPTFMRLTRMCKLVRILRSIRVLKFFRELRVMLLALLSSTMSLVWSMVMVAFILYLFGLVFIQGVTSQILIDFGGQQHKLSSEVPKLFGTLDAAMLTLYQAVTGGQDWAPIYDATLKIGSSYAWFFLFFTIFFMFAVVNIVTAIYVDSVQKNSQPDHQEILEDWRRAHKIQRQTMTKLIEEMDTDHSGKINHEEFQALAKSETLTALLETLGIHVSDAEILFHLMTSFADKAELEVDRDMFLNSLLRIKGKASAIDLQVLSFQLKLVHQGQSKLREHLRQLQNSIGKPHFAL